MSPAKPEPITATRRWGSFGVEVSAGIRVILGIYASETGCRLLICPVIAVDKMME